MKNSRAKEKAPFKDLKLLGKVARFRAAQLIVTTLLWR